MNTKSLKSRKLSAFMAFAMLCAFALAGCGETAPAVPADTEAPVIEGVADLQTYVGTAVSYRTGVSVTDDTDENVELVIDASAVDLFTPGVYDIVYSAVDAAGNEAKLIASLTVEEKPESEEGEDAEGADAPESSTEITSEMVNALADSILAKITTPSMSKYEKAKAIHKYLYDHIKYIGHADKLDYEKAGYIGLKSGKGDCYTYSCAAKVLLTRCQISNIQMERVGGWTEHYWNAVNTGNGYYHFDACWQPTGYKGETFMIDESTARAYTKRLADAGVRTNYYTYDYKNCPVKIVGWEKYAPDYGLPYPEGYGPEEPAVTPAPQTPAAPVAPNQPAEPPKEEAPADPTLPGEDQQPQQPEVSPVPDVPGTPVEPPADTPAAEPQPELPAQDQAPEGLGI